VVPIFFDETPEEIRSKWVPPGGGRTGLGEGLQGWAEEGLAEGCGRVRDCRGGLWLCPSETGVAASEKGVAAPGYALAAAWAPAALPCRVVYVSWHEMRTRRWAADDGGGWCENIEQLALPFLPASSPAGVCFWSHTHSPEFRPSALGLFAPQVCRHQRPAAARRRRQAAAGTPLL
jgi:hypothetical protein